MEGEPVHPDLAHSYPHFKLEDSYIIAENLVISVRRSRIPIQRSSPARGVCPAVAAWPCSRGIIRSIQAQLYHLNRCYEEELSEQDHSEAESAQLFHSKDHPNSELKGKVCEKIKDTFPEKLPSQRDISSNSSMAMLWRELLICPGSALSSLQVLCHICLIGKHEMLQHDHSFFLPPPSDQVKTKQKYCIKELAKFSSNYQGSWFSLIKKKVPNFQIPIGRNKMYMKKAK